MIEDATVIIDGPVDGEIFTRYTEYCLVPALRPGDVVVTPAGGQPQQPQVGRGGRGDPGGRRRGVVPAAVLAGPRAPPNAPIEKLWSKVKAWLRRFRPPNFDAIGRALVDVLRTVKPGECRNYCRSCGYRT